VVIWEYDLISGAYYHSDNIEEMLGYSSAELSTHSAVLSHTVPEDIAGILAAADAYLNGPTREYQVEQRFITRSGKVRSFLARGTVLRDADGRPVKMIGSSVDITEQKLTERRLERQMRYQSALARFSHALMSPYDGLEMRWPILSIALQHLREVAEVGHVHVFRNYHDPELGLTATLVAEACGPGVNSALTAAFARRLPWSFAPEHELRVLEQGEPFGGVVAEVYNDVPVVRDLLMQYAEVRFIQRFPIHIQGQWWGIVGYADSRYREPYDEQEVMLLRTAAEYIGQVIRRWETEDALRASEEQLRYEQASLVRRVNERTAELSTANAQLARALTVRDEFLASMSHELRTPLTVILGFIDALKLESYGQITEAQRTVLGWVEKSGRHLLALINDILDLSRIEAGAMALRWAAVSPVVVCRHSLDMVAPSAREKRLRVTSTFDNGVDILVTDERRLTQILVNLLSNAVKFTSEGGTIGIELVGHADAGLVEISVWDTGIGIHAENFERLFQPFVQVDGSLTREYGGAGLGLALVARLVELLGGSVEVTSTVGQGSRFTVRLPWQLDEQVELLPQASEVDPTRRAHGSRLPSGGRRATVLVVDDVELTLQLLGDYLSHEGWHVVLARTADEAVARAEEMRPDIILMDIQMPEVSGLEAIRRIRASAGIADTYIIALTALVMPGDRDRCLDAGADQYVSKPVGLDVLGEMLAAVLSRKLPSSIS
jgi:PAS domain S-box-containing protein